jgi:hypothetical protein
MTYRTTSVTMDPDDPTKINITVEADLEVEVDLECVVARSVIRAVISEVRDVRDNEVALVKCFIFWCQENNWQDILDKLILSEYPQYKEIWQKTLLLI